MGDLSRPFLEDDHPRREGCKSLDRITPMFLSQKIGDLFRGNNNT